MIEKMECICFTYYYCYMINAARLLNESCEMNKYGKCIYVIYVCSIYERESNGKKPLF